MHEDRNLWDMGVREGPNIAWSFLQDLETERS